MITRTRRAMTIAEVAEVERLSRDSWEAAGCLLVFLALTAFGAGVAGALAGFFASLVLKAETERLPITGFVLGVGFVLSWYRGEVRRPERVFATDLVTGELELIHVHAVTAAVGREPETFVFDVGEDQMLVVRGPATRLPVSAGRFPNRYFTLVRLPRADRTLRIDCHGEPLPAQTSEVDVSQTPDGAVVSGSIS